MRKTSFSLLMLFITAITLSAQSNKEEIEFFQSIFGMEKKAIVSEFVKLDEASSAAFWEVYDNYETERKALGQKRIELLKKYAENYNKLTDEKIDELMSEMISQKKSLDKLTEKYYKQVKKVAGSKAAAQFLQIETYILSAIRLSIFESIPFIGELGE